LKCRRFGKYYFGNILVHKNWITFFDYDTISTKYYGKYCAPTVNNTQGLRGGYKR